MEKLQSLGADKDYTKLKEWSLNKSLQTYFISMNYQIKTTPNCMHLVFLCVHFIGNGWLINIKNEGDSLA